MSFIYSVRSINILNNVDFSIQRNIGKLTTAKRINRFILLNLDDNFHLRNSYFKNRLNLDSQDELQLSICFR